MTLYICHVCSNIKSPSGEACILKDDYHEGKYKIVHGCYGCFKNYMIPVTEKMRKECSLILPDELDFETDFYKVESDEARRTFDYVLKAPLWDVIFMEARPLSNEERLWQDAHDQIETYRQYRRGLRAKELRRQEIVEEAHAFMELGVPCRLEEDPILRL